MAKIVHLMNRERFDLIVSNTITFAEGALASRYCGIPHVWYVHEMLMDDPVLRSFLPLESLYRIMDGLSSHFVAVSEAVKRQFDPYVNNEKLSIVHTGLPDIKPASLDQPKKTMFDLPQHIPVVTFVGILSERKGILDFVESARLVLQRFPKPYSSWRVRRGKGREAIAQIDKYGIRDSFRILGNRNDVAGILAASDMLVLPSLADPLPLAVLEAMAAGIPVVATRSGGSEEMVVDHVTGRLVPVKNPAVLSQAITELIESPSMRVLMGLNGSRRYADHFNYAHYISRFEEILDGACDGSSRLIDNDGSRTSVDNLVAQLRDSAIAQARIMATQAGGLKKITSNIEASVRCWSLM